MIIYKVEMRNHIISFIHCIDHYFFIKTIVSYHINQQSSSCTFLQLNYLSKVDGNINTLYYMLHQRCFYIGITHYYFNFNFLFFSYYFSPPPPW